MTDNASSGASVARSHHYVPEFYLSGFTATGSSTEFLFVHDLQTGRVWRQRPREVACERDFYRVDLEQGAADAVEQALAEFESSAAQAIVRIRTAWQLPEGGDFELLMNFVALQTTRVPQFRRMFERNKAHLARSRVKFAVSNPDVYRRVVDDLRQEGQEPPPGLTREDLVQAIDDEERFPIQIPREASVRNMMEMAEALLPVLAERKWSLLVAPDDAPFVCSDCPVALVPTKPGRGFMGFGSGNTEILMPLDRRVALVGSWDDEGRTVAVNPDQVVAFNRRLIDRAERFVYAAIEIPMATASGNEPDSAP